jgi:hypothetical protein
VQTSYLLTLHAQDDIDLEADAIEDEDAAARWVNEGCCQELCENLL